MFTIHDLPLKIVPQDSKNRSLKAHFSYVKLLYFKSFREKYQKTSDFTTFFNWLICFSRFLKLRNWSKSHDSHKKCTYEWILPIHALVIPKIDVKGEIPNNWRSDLDHPWSMNSVIAVVVKFCSASVAYWRIIWNFSRPQLGSISSSNEGSVQVTKCGNLSNNRRR